MVDGIAGCDQRDNVFVTRLLRILKRHEVRRVGHREIQGILRNRHRYDTMLLRKRLRDILRHLRCDILLREVDIIDTKLHPERIDDLRLRDIAIVHERFAETRMLLLLKLQRLLKLLLGNQMAVHQHIAKTFCFHAMLLALPK